MKIWLPYVSAGSGSDVFVRRLATALEAAGHAVVLQAFPNRLQYVPDLLRSASLPAGVDIVLASSWNGFAFKRASVPLVVVEHHCVLDPAYKPYRSFAQGIFHETLVRHFEARSFRAADRIVAVSDYTAKVVRAIFPWTQPLRIYNGIDTTFFSPADTPAKHPNFTLLFVGNNTRRKGADLLPKIIELLPEDFRLRYTAGLRDRHMDAADCRLQATGRLTDVQLREEYRNAHVLVFPTRYEGFGYAAAEAMACGTPVIASESSSLPELVRHDKAGLLCQTDSPRAFADAITRLATDATRLKTMGLAARERVIRKFGTEMMTQRYLELFHQLQSQYGAA